MEEKLHLHEREITAEALREVLDCMVPYVKSGVLQPQLIDAPKGKLFLIESESGVALGHPAGKSEIVRQFVSNTIYVRTSKLVANEARDIGIEINTDDLILEASTPLDNRENNSLRIVADYEKTRFSFIESTGE